jgi:ABC-type transporter lipoprotein component MlaA
MGRIFTHGCSILCALATSRDAQGELYTRYLDYEVHCFKEQTGRIESIKIPKVQIFRGLMNESEIQCQKIGDYQMMNH